MTYFVFRARDGWHHAFASKRDLERGVAFEVFEGTQSELQSKIDALNAPISSTFLAPNPEFNLVAHLAVTAQSATLEREQLKRHRREFGVRA